MKTLSKPALVLAVLALLVSVCMIALDGSGAVLKADGNERDVSAVKENRDSAPGFQLPTLDATPFPAVSEGSSEGGSGGG